MKQKKHCDPEQQSFLPCLVPHPRHLSCSAPSLFSRVGKLSDTIMGNPVLSLWMLDKHHLFKHLMMQQGYIGAVQEAIKGLVHYFVWQSASRPAPFMVANLPCGP